MGFRSGVKVWGVKVWGGVKVGVKVVVKVGVKVRGQGRGVKVEGSRSWGQNQGHDWWSQGLGPRSGSMLGVKVRGVVKVLVRGSISGALGSDGRWGEVGDEHFVTFKN